jgi:hypothetical protein
MSARDDFIEREHAIQYPNGSEIRLRGLPDPFVGTPCPQTAQDAPGRHPAYKALDHALERLSSSGGSQTRQRAFEIIRDTLEAHGVPFLRANALAEACYKALGEIL